MIATTDVVAIHINLRWSLRIISIGVPSVSVCQSAGDDLEAEVAVFLSCYPYISMNGLDFFSEVGNIHPDDADIHVRFITPDIAEKLVGRNSFPFVHHKVGKELRFLARQADGTGAGKFLLRHIQLDIAFFSFVGMNSLMRLVMERMRASSSPMANGLAR